MVFQSFEYNCELLFKKNVEIHICSGYNVLVTFNLYVFGWKILIFARLILVLKIMTF